MNKTIQYYTKNVYGKELLYLAKQDDLLMWKYISGRTTITKPDMVRLTALTGVSFERVFEPAVGV